MASVGGGNRPITARQLDRRWVPHLGTLLINTGLFAKKCFVLGANISRSVDSLNFTKRQDIFPCTLESMKTLDLMIGMSALGHWEKSCGSRKIRFGSSSSQSD